MTLARLPRLMSGHAAKEPPKNPQAPQAPPGPSVPTTKEPDVTSETIHTPGKASLHFTSVATKYVATTGTVVATRVLREGRL